MDSEVDAVGLLSVASVWCLATINTCQYVRLILLGGSTRVAPEKVVVTYLVIRITSTISQSASHQAVVANT